MFSYKTDPNIYYIGRAKDFHKRLKAHLNINLKDRFHVFANAMGLHAAPQRLRRDKFNFSIIEICGLDMHQEKENYYLQKYLPLLNTIFISNMSETQTYDSLWLAGWLAADYCYVVSQQPQQKVKTKKPEVENLELSEKLISDIIQGLELDRNIAKKYEFTS
jgi:hypothetical protein